MSPLQPRTLWMFAALFAVSALSLDWRRLNARATEASPPPAALLRPAPIPAPAAEVDVPVSAGMRVLFVGNSLTSFNDLPHVIGELAKAAGEARPFTPVAELKGGASLAGHLQVGRVQARIAQEGPWHAVVLQEHGGFAAASAADLQRHTVPSVQALQSMIVTAGAQPLLFVPYARRGGHTAGDSYDAMQDRVNENHTALTKDLGIATVPVGEIWRSALRRKPALQLWDERGMHPSLAGTYLAACAFYTQLYGNSPVGNAYTGGLALEDARVIQETVASMLSTD